MSSLKRTYSKQVEASRVSPALLEARDLFAEILPEEPWKSHRIIYTVQDTIQKFKDSTDALVNSNFDRVFLSKRLSGEKYGQAVYALLDKWSNSGKPSISAITDRAADYFKLDERDRLGLMVASVLGSFDSGLPYHNAAHNRKVVLQAVRLAVEAPELSSHDVSKLLIAACIHDLGHDGKGNIESGVHKPFLLEKRAFESARPYLQRAGLTPDELEDIKTLVLSTDVSPLGSKDSPSHIFAIQPEKLPSELSRLRMDSPLAKSARMLEVADIASSAALCCEQAWKECGAISSEMNCNSLDQKLSNFSLFMRACEPILQALPETRFVYEDNPERIRRNIDSFARGQSRVSEQNFKIQ